MSLIFLSSHTQPEVQNSRISESSPQLNEKMEVDARMNMAVEELETRLAEEADEQLLERKRFVCA